MEKLLKIKDYIVENFPKTTLALNKEEFGEHLKDHLLQTLNDVFLHEIIGICGCGDPDLCRQDILNFLDAYSVEFLEREKKLKKYFGAKDIYDNSLLLFMAYILDDKELLEHGGSIGGAWITELGQMCKHVFKECNKEMVDD